MNANTFAVEESDHDLSRYKHIHKAGCRDLRDPEIVHSSIEVTDRATLVEALDGYASAESVEELDDYLAPCAARLL